MLDSGHLELILCTCVQIQLIRIELRVPEYGWTTQKVFHLMNFIVNGGNIKIAFDFILEGGILRF